MNSKDNLDASYYWFRVEYQARGTAHVHGCLKLRSDPGITKLCEIVRDGRLAKRKLELAGLRSRVLVCEENCMNDSFLSRQELIKHGFVIKNRYTDLSW